MPDSPRLEVRLRHKLGTLRLDIDFVTCASWSILFGPSGSGKSTVLRAIAGILRPDFGQIVIDGTVVFDSERGICLPPQERRMRWAPQRAMLFPKLSVRQNLKLGVPGKDGADSLQAAIQHFRLLELSRMFPDELSGGQRQRVGVIRAAAGLKGGLLLLDEPFAGLDAAVRDRLAMELRTWRGFLPVLSVTHDVSEAFLLGAEVIRIAEGRIVAQGLAEDVLAGERKNLLDTLG